MPRGDSARPPLQDAPGIGATLVTRALNILAWTLAPLLLLPLAHNWLHGGALAVGLIGAYELAILAALWLNRIGSPRAGATVLIGGGWLLCFALAGLGGGGTRDVVLFALAPVLLGAGVLVDRRFLWTLTGLTVAGLVMLWIAEDRGWIAVHPPARAEFTAVIDAAVILVMTATATAVLTTDLRRTLESETRHAAALQRSELRLRTAIELAADAILLADEGGRITEANSRACTILARKRGEIIGAGLFELMPPDVHPRSSDVRTRIDRGEVVTTERTLTHAGSAELVVETTWQRLPDRSLQCFIRDITARRRLEDQLRHAQKMEAVGALAGGIAHDFNNLITVMKGFLELIEADSALPEELTGHVAELRTACMQATDLTQQLLAFAGHRPLDRHTLDVRDLLTANQRMVSRLVGDSIKVVVEPLTTPCPVFVDPVLFTQVLLNLAANSRDAMPGGGRIVVAAIAPSPRTPARVGPEGFVVRDYTGIRFSDTGIGIAPDALARVFEPFFTTKQTGRNSGLGLAMVHGIVERHGGWIEIESAPGSGTTFRLFLPVHNPADLADTPAALTPAPNGATILVVDDDGGVRRLAMQALTQGGYSVVEADSGPEALAAWDEHGGRIDLVFTDMVMPGGMNGLQLIDACRERKPLLPAILTSGYTLPPLGRACTTPGELRMIAKPYAYPVLIETVQLLLAGGRRG